MTLDNQIFKDVFLGSSNSFISPTTPVSKMLVTLDGIHSGVPTRTTSTLTPTTLRNIEQTFFELTNDTSNTVPCQAGFVPPLPQFEQESQDNSLGSSGSNSSGSWDTYPSKNDSIIDGNSSEAITDKSSNSKRNMGGRRPKTTSNLSPEEEEKRKVRRERNKLAAARCRKRRVDQTNELLDKVSQLEQERGRLEKEIQDLQNEKEDIQFVLESHLNQCKLAMTKAMDTKPKLPFKEPQPNHLPLIDKIKVEVDEDFKVDSYDDRDTMGHPPAAKRVLLSQSVNPIIGGAITNPSAGMNTVFGGKPNRPSSLNVPYQMTPSQTLCATKNIADIAGIQITTPSNVVAFNFESLMDGGTGLTPVAMPTYSSQNKTPLDLATPTSEPSKLVSL